METWAKLITCTECNDKVFHTHVYDDGQCRSCYQKEMQELLKKKQKGKPLSSEQKMKNRLRKYGLNYSEFRGMLAVQDFSCAICTVELDESSASIDHDHQTGKVRGLLCTRCNVGLGNWRDSITALASAIAYLQKHKPI